MFTIKSFTKLRNISKQQFLAQYVQEVHFDLPRLHQCMSQADSSAQKTSRWLPEWTKGGLPAVQNQPLDEILNVPQEDFKHEYNAKYDNACSSYSLLYEEQKMMFDDPRVLANRTARIAQFRNRESLVLNTCCQSCMEATMGVHRSIFATSLSVDKDDNENGRSSLAARMLRLFSTNMASMPSVSRLNLIGKYSWFFSSPTVDQSVIKNVFIPLKTIDTHLCQTKEPFFTTLPNWNLLNLALKSAIHARL